MAVLLLRCPDHPGIVARVSSLLAELGANIVEADQHTDRQHDLFLQRVQVDLPDGLSIESLRERFEPIATDLDMEWSIHGDERARLGILVSKQGHCLMDLLGRAALGELPADIAVVISNHVDHQAITEKFGLPFVHLPIDRDRPEAQHQALLAELDAHHVDLVAMARYMQILPPMVLDAYPHRIINIHHSFLPAFVGAKPYHQAAQRGVKIIGATAHYATADLDEGPIITQDTTPVSHRDDVDRLVSLGRDLEMVVLARAVQLHVEHRVMAYANRTVVFD